MKLIDITGQRFGRLLVLTKGAVSKTGGSNWVCVCDCGTEKIANASNLRNGSTSSCGCVAREHAQKMGADPALIKRRADTAVSHGHKRRGAASLEYKTWLRMKSRCNNPKDKDFDNWGGRGIKVCERWEHSFQTFLDDMGHKPSPMHSIDRINVNCNYEPGNCRWATPIQQATENRRNLLPVVVNGIHYPTHAEACRQIGINHSTVVARLASGCSIEDAFKLGRKKPVRTPESYIHKHKRLGNSQ